jgi:hypothetical protein
MENPYLEKATRAVDERLDKSTDELQALALIAIATELRAIRLHLERATPPTDRPTATSEGRHHVSDGIVIG